MKKKTVSILLVACMSLMLAACGNGEKDVVESGSEVEGSSSEVSESTEEVVESEPEEEVTYALGVAQKSVSYDEEVFEGIKLMVGVNGCDGQFPAGDDGVVGVDDLMSYYFTSVGISVKEFGEMNNVDVALLPAASTFRNNLPQYVVTGDQPDLLVISEVLPEGAALDVYEDLSEYYDYFANKYGKEFVDSCVFDGKLLALISPVYSQYSMTYDYAYFRDNGIKSPGEYFLEGEWTWENYQKMLNEVAKDENGDGIKEAIGASNRWMSFLMYSAYYVEEGKLVNNVSTEQGRAYAQLQYEVNTVDDVIDDVGVVTTPKVAGETYVATGVWPGNVSVVEATGVDISAPKNIIMVPGPVYDKANPQFNAEATFLAVPKGANKEAAVALIDHLMTAAMDYNEYLSLIPSSEDNWTGFYGATPLSETFIQVLEQRRDAGWEVIEDLNTNGGLGYDVKELYKAVGEYYQNATPNFKYQAKSVAIPWSELEGREEFAIMLEAPAATSVATVSDWIQSRIDEFNSSFLGK